MTSPAAPLAGLRPDLLPPDPGWWPLAPGWWLLLLVVLSSAAWWGPRAFRAASVSTWRAYWRLRLRREVSRARARPDGNVALAVAQTLRQAAVARFGQEHAGGLTGDAWLQFLHRSCHGRAPFTRDGNALLSLPYAPVRSRGTSDESARLMALADVWVRTC